MKTIVIACALMLAGATGRPAAAQEPDHPPRPEMRDRLDRLERMKQMRLIEDLNLGEEEAVRFMAKRKEHEDRLKGLADERDAILDGIEGNVGPRSEAGSEGKPGKSPGGKAGTTAEAKPDLAAVEKDLSRLQEQERKIFEERKRYQDEMRKMLSTERYAKMLLFERDFQAQLRDAVGRGRGMGKRSQKFDE
jgi:hypothetical protein